MLGRILGQLNPLQNIVTRLIKMKGVSLIDANSSVAAHATTMDPWSLGNYVTLTGAVVTFTALTAAPQAGAEVELYMNAAHIFTDGAVFEVDGNANYTATIGDRVVMRAKSTTVFTVRIRRANDVAAGSVIQTVSVTKSDTFTTTSTTFVDITGLSVSITLSSTSNKVLVFPSVNGSQDVATNAVMLNLVRDSTSICMGDAAGSRIRVHGGFSSAANSLISGTVGTPYLDSPASVSALTYKLQVATIAGASTAYINRTTTDTDSANFVRSASTITVMEIKG